PGVAAAAGRRGADRRLRLRARSGRPLARSRPQPFHHQGQLLAGALAPGRSRLPLPRTETPVRPSPAPAPRRSRLLVPALFHLLAGAGALSPAAAQQEPGEAAAVVPPPAAAPVPR